MFTYFKKRRELKAKAKTLYREIVEQSRNPVFYERYGVPDTIDGRFDMVALHCYIMMRRLQAAGQKKLSQKLFDVFFVTMDRTLREMGIGDLGVPKHMKRMMQGFNGRAAHYEEALDNQDNNEMTQALLKNVYGTVENPSEEEAKALADYVMASAEIDSLEPVFTAIEFKEKRHA